MKKHLAMAGESRNEAMEQLQQEADEITGTVQSTKAKVSFSIFFGTLAKMCDAIFDYLPPQQIGEIATACGAWCNLGIVLGKDPELLVRILDRVKPPLHKVDYPTWLTQSLGGLGKDPPEPE